jgi:Zn finger protein HypA/HybF involved in hydrogenase expression
MSSIKSITVSALTLGLGLVAAGCQANSKDSSATSTDHALMCAKCETVWVPEVRGQGTKVTVLTSAAKMTCPTCDSMAKSHLTGDGKVQLHDCPDCKVAPKPVFSGTPRPTHPKGTH